MIDKSDIFDDFEPICKCSCVSRSIEMCNLSSASEKKLFFNLKYKNTLVTELTKFLEKCLNSFLNSCSNVFKAVF